MQMEVSKLLHYITCIMKFLHVFPVLLVSRSK